MRVSAIVALVSLSAMTPTAFAETELYLNGGASAYDAGEATLTVFTARGGVALNDLLGAELEASFGVGAEEFDVTPGAEIELESQFGGYLVGRYPILPRIDFLGRLGYTTGEFQISNNGVSGDVEADGVAFGLGGEFMVTDQLGLRGDYTRINVDDDRLDGGVNVFSLSAVYKFGTVR